MADQPVTPPSRPAESPGRLRGPTILAGCLLLALLLTGVVLGRAAGREPRSAWLCDDTRLTQLVPRGRAVVGAPVSPPPGCAP